MTLQEVEKKHGVYVANIVARIFLYIYAYLFFGGVLTFIRFFNTNKLELIITGDFVTDNIIIYSSLLVPLIILELLVRRYRRKQGLPIYSNVAQEIFNKYYNPNYNNETKKDLNYYFDLKEKGAITQKEYEVKKNELLDLK
ncbi:hypothetical protein [Malaciobacter pacificus]|uniref:SHOCT domain-containing membrane protein n=2 Tax=Malaciobacter pacificus TaxID=1080223 RepID=A0A5C2HFJ1_9BACT|nr:hypothetical protein [Malaciobacter pacificus]QEP35182.1 SHOCT domain-containing membrane protein [Malaciobacter pacificus]